MNHSQRLQWCFTWFFTAFVSAAIAADAKPRVAVFPLTGTVSEKERERAAFSIRAKLDRQGVYESIDGITMGELCTDKQITFHTSIDEVTEFSREEKPDLIIWGEYDSSLKLNVLDLRETKPKVREFTHAIDHPTDLRFAVEALVESLPGSKKHEHVTEETVVRDPQAEKMWKEGKNLFTEGTFDQPGDWRGILAADKYAPALSEKLPDVDRVAISKSADNNVLSMRLSKSIAESYGLACLSGKIEIEPKMRYRISFRYKSDGPVSRPFIKGYFIHEGAEREIYRRQIPPQGSTDGQWVTIVDECNPQHTTFTVQYLRVDFYAYLKPGLIQYDDVVIKPVGAQTREAKDESLDPTVKSIQK